MKLAMKMPMVVASSWSWGRGVIGIKEETLAMTVGEKISRSVETGYLRYAATRSGRHILIWGFKNK